MKICIETQDDGSFSVYEETMPENAQVVKSVEQALSVAGQLLSQQQTPEQQSAEAGFKQGLAQTAPQRAGMMPMMAGR